MQTSPYKFLDSYSKEDRDIFFGRDREIEELYSGVFRSRILLVYGISGTGKSSLINCGLANKFSDSDWLPVTVRRGHDINLSLLAALEKISMPRDTPAKRKPEGENNAILNVLRAVYLDQFKPIYLIFDQFEELFIFGTPGERQEFIRSVRAVTDSDLQCRFIFSIREEYLAGITEFEKVIPSFFANRMRIEKMTRHNAALVIEGPCLVRNIAVEQGFSARLLEKLNPDNPEVELTWLQVYLDRLFRMASEEGQEVNRLSLELLDRAGDVKDLLGSFLEEQISQLGDPESGMTLLKSFVSVKGTRLRITKEEAVEYSGNFGKGLTREQAKELIQTFIRLRILRDKDENGRYELRHDSLAAKIFEMITMVEKELLEVRQFLENALNNYEKRHVFLSADDLSYIAPYEDKLFLNEKVQKFIAQSRWVLQKARRRRQNILLTAVIIIITVLSSFTIWALKERTRAREQKVVADQQRETALREKAAADSARQQAMASREEALVSRNQAVEQKLIAEDQRRLAEWNASEARKQRSIAMQQTDSARRAGLRAEENARIADARRVEALRLRMLSAGKAVAIKSLQVQDQKDLQALLAYQAYLFNKDNGGYQGDADIFMALYNVARQYGKKYYRVLPGHYGEIKSIAFVPGKSDFFTSGFDSKLFRWIPEGDNYISRLIYSGPEVIEVCSVSPGGEWLACGMRNGTIRMIPLTDTLKAVYEMKGHAMKINSLIFSSEGKYLYSASLDGRILKWDTWAKSFTETETGGISIISIDISGDGNYFAGITSGGKAFVWSEGNFAGRFPAGHSSGRNVKTLKFKPGEDILALGYTDGYVELWDVKTRKNVAEIKAHSAEVNAVRFNPALFQMATAGNDRTVKIWDVRDMTMPPVIFSDNDGFVMTLEFSPGGNSLVSGTYEGTNNLVMRPVNADLLAGEICSMITRYMTPEEWATYIGRDIGYEKPVQLKNINLK